MLWLFFVCHFHFARSFARLLSGSPVICCTIMFVTWCIFHASITIYSFKNIRIWLSHTSFDGNCFLFFFLLWLPTDKKCYNIDALDKGITLPPSCLHTKCIASPFFLFKLHHISSKLCTIWQLFYCYFSNIFITRPEYFFVAFDLKIVFVKYSLLYEKCCKQTY